MYPVQINKSGKIVILCGIILVLCWIFVRYMLDPWYVPGLLFTASNSTSSSANLKWWQTTVIYQIYPRSFQDSNGDGTGDLKGILSRLGHLQFLNVGAIWISPFYKSPMRDFGYDVTDYKQVDPIFGNIADFETLVKECHYRGIKVVIDFVPNHTSNGSVWFQRSRSAGPGDKYRDYYVWSPGEKLPNGSRVPPNNWESSFGGSAWAWDARRQEFYYHAFLPSQPDLNYRNDYVLQEIDSVLDFWLDKGVDGFRIDAITKLYEAENLTLNSPFRKHKDEYVYNLFKNTENLPDIFKVVKRWRAILDKWEGRHASPKVLIAETPRISKEHRELYYSCGAVPFYFDLIRAEKQCGATAQCFVDYIREGTALSSPGRWPNFVIGNHDNKRVADVMGDDYVDAMNLLLLTLPGTPTTYNGEELGMHAGNYTGMVPKDTYAYTSGKLENSRDPQRNPMLWDSSVNAGFSTSSKPWLPVTDNTKWQTTNAQEQKKSTTSHLSIYKALVQLRQNPAFLNPYLSDLNAENGVLIYTRKSLTESYLVAINFSDKDSVVDTEVEHNGGSVVMTTKEGTVAMTTSKQGRSLDRNNLKQLEIKRAEGLIILLTK